MFGSIAGYTSVKLLRHAAPHSEPLKNVAETCPSSLHIDLIVCLTTLYPENILYDSNGRMIMHYELQRTWKERSSVPAFR